MSNRKAIGICRVSSELQEDRTSLDSQSLEIERYCQDRSLNLIKMFKLVETASKKDRRIGYRGAIDFAIDNDIYNIVFYIDDRESRNLSDIEENSALIQKGTIAIHYAKYGTSIDQNSPDATFLHREITGVMNKHYVRLFRSRIEEGYRRKALSGSYAHSALPMGYEWEKKSGKLAKVVLSSNPMDIEIVKSQFKLRAERIGLREIVRIIEEDFGYRCSFSTLQRRINNIFYQGKFTYKEKVYSGDQPVFIEPEIIRAATQSFYAEPIRRRTRLKRTPELSKVFLFGGAYQDVELSGFHWFLGQEKYLDSFATFKEACSKVLDRYRLNPWTGNLIDLEHPSNDDNRVRRLTPPEDDVLCEHYLRYKYILKDIPT